MPKSSKDRARIIVNGGLVVARKPFRLQNIKCQGRVIKKNMERLNEQSMPLRVGDRTDPQTNLSDIGDFEGA